MIVMTFDGLSDRHQPPHRNREIATHTTARGTVVRLVSNGPRNMWWLTASKLGLRMANCVRTTSKRIADGWQADLLAGNVKIE